MGDKNKEVTDSEETEVLTDPSKVKEDSIKENVGSMIANQKNKETKESLLKDDSAVEDEQTSESEEGDRPGNDTSQTDAKEDSQTLSKDEKVLDLAKAVSGREFKSVEDFEKHLKNLYSLVGDEQVTDVRKKAEMYDNLVDKLSDHTDKSTEEVKKFWAETLLSMKDEVKTDVSEKANEQTGKLDNRLKRLEDSNEKMNLLTKYPYAAEIANEIALIAQDKDISYIKAFEESPFKSLLEAKAKEATEKSPVVTPSNRVGYDRKRIQELGSRAMSDRATDDDKIELVTEVLGLK